MLNLNELVVFLEAADTGNFSQAARRLTISQPAVSQAMENLSRHVGIDLFARQGRSVVLTEAGQALVPMARELLAAARRLDENMASLQGQVFGEMSVGCSTASGKYLLPGLIARFRQQYPQVRINVDVLSRQVVINRLLTGEIPIGVSSKQVEHNDLEYQDFFTDEVILIVSAGHRWAGYGHIFPDDLLDEPLIVREETAGTWEVTLQGLHDHDVSPELLQISMRLGNAEAIVMAVEESIGVAFVSRLAAARSLVLGRVREVQVEGMLLQRSIWMVRNRNRAATRSQRMFWEFAGQADVQARLKAQLV